MDAFLTPELFSGLQGRRGQGGQGGQGHRRRLHGRSRQPEFRKGFRFEIPGTDLKVRHRITVRQVS